MKQILFYFSILLFVAAITGIWAFDYFYRDVFDVESLVGSKVEMGGTPGRIEREYKLEIKNAMGPDIPIIRRTISAALAEAVKNEKWNIYQAVDSRYQVRDRFEVYPYLDFYFETSDRSLIEKYGVAYRLRYRWKSMGGLLRFVAGVRNSDDLPIRLELQCKYDRRFVEPGLSEVIEARFEFRDESDPFSEIFPAPQTPWPFLDYFFVAKSGVFDGIKTSAAYECARAISRINPNAKLRLMPTHMVLTLRSRSHLLLKTPWGWGPNPDDAFLITLDQIFISSEVAQFIRQTESPKAWPNALRLLFSRKSAEIEIEFERNVSTNVLKGGNSQVVNLFLKDQKLISDSLVREISRRGYDIFPSNRSKGE